MKRARESNTSVPLLKNQHLIQPERSVQGSNILYKLLQPLIERGQGPLISTDSLKTLADKFGNFYNQDPTDEQERRRQFDALDESKRKEFLDTTPVTHIKGRPDLGKQLGRFTIEGLSRINGNPPFKGVELDPKLAINGRPARGSFRQPGTLFLNPNIKQDMLSTIVHEGNHALENYNPYIKSTVEDFFKKKIESTPDKQLSAGYIPQLYEGIQHIINMAPDFTQDSYRADNSAQQNVVTREALNKTWHGLESSFSEVPAYALESLMRGAEWRSNTEGTNPDSRKLLKNLMKETHQIYSNLGLVDRTQQPLGGNPAYRYKKEPVPNYPTPGAKYDNINNSLIGRINSLSNPRKVSQALPTTSPYSSYSSFSNPYSAPYSPATTSLSYTTTTGLNFPSPNSSSSSSSSAPPSPLITQGDPNIPPTASMLGSYYTPQPATTLTPAYKKGGGVSKNNLFRRFKSNKGKLLSNVVPRG